MALVNGTNFDHIDLQAVPGGDTTRHMLQDTQARNDISEVRSALRDKAQIDGHYGDMTVGNAEQIIATVGVEDKVPYNFRTSGGSADIGDREVDKIVGGTLGWNQRVNHGNFDDGTTGWNKGSRISNWSAANNELTFTFSSDSEYNFKNIYTNTFRTIPGGHQVLTLLEIARMSEDTSAIRYGAVPGTTIPSGAASNSISSTTMANLEIGAWYKAGGIIPADLEGVIRFIIGTVSNTGNKTCTFKIRNVMVFDLTEMFGSAIADYISSLATGSVAWFRNLFPKDYYAYDAGTLRSVQVSAHKTVGFNAYDNATGKALVIGGNEYEITGTYTALTLNGETVTPVDGKFTPAKSGELTVTGGDGTTCIHLRWDGERDGEFEPYKAHTYTLDSDLVLNGIPKLDASNRLYYDGDIYESDGTVTRRYGAVNLGTLSWSYNTSDTYPTFQSASLSGYVSTSGKVTYVCSKYAGYPATGGSAYRAENHEKTICLGATNIFVQDSDYTDAAAFKESLAGVYLIYELVTPTAETAAPFTNPQIVDDFGTEQYIYAGNRDVEIPVGHETFYRQNLRAKLEMAPNSPESNGDYLMRRNNGQNSYVVYESPLPALPAEDGTYTLKCTVSGGTAALSWESES